MLCRLVVRSNRQKVQSLVYTTTSFLFSMFSNCCFRYIFIGLLLSTLDNQPAKCSTIGLLLTARVWSSKLLKASLTYSISSPQTSLVPYSFPLIPLPPPPPKYYWGHQRPLPSAALDAGDAMLPREWSDSQD